MKFQILIPSLLVGVLVLSGCNTAPSPHEPDVTPPTNETQAQQETTATIQVMDEDGNTMMDDDSMMEAEKKPGAEAQTMTFTNPSYSAYSDGIRAQLNGSKPHVIFFHAQWCPTCRALEENILANLSSFPAGTTILKADYDTENELKDEFDVKIQSTVAVLDANGEVVWQGQDPSIEDLQGYITESLN